MQAVCAATSRPHGAVMSDIGPWRRLLPPPRRRPSLAVVVVRWRVELLLATGVAAVWHYAGWEAIAVLVTVCCTSMILEPVRRLMVALAQTVVVPHRLRSALIQAGVADREGRPPRIIWARPTRDAVLASVWLRSGTTLADLSSAISVISTACGAQDAEVMQSSARQDWAVVVVHRPRWGLL